MWLVHIQLFLILWPKEPVNHLHLGNLGMSTVVSLEEGSSSLLWIHNVISDPLQLALLSNKQENIIQMTSAVSKGQNNSSSPILSA